MKKQFLSTAAVFLLWFFSSFTPVLAAALPQEDLPARQAVLEQPVTIQNIFKLFQLFKQPRVKKAPALEAPESAREAAVRRRADRSSAEGDRAFDRDPLSSPMESPALTADPPAQDALSPDLPLPAPTASSPEEDPTSLSPAEAPVSTSVPPDAEAVEGSRAQKAQILVDQAKEYQGVRYVWGGTTPSGFDCSGFVLYLYENNGVSLPRVAASQFQAGTPVAKNQLQAGDLVFFNTDGSGVSHVGIYVAEGDFIHASSGAHKVTQSNLSSGYYASRYLGAKRILP